jgi:hypothetical protein
LKGAGAYPLAVVVAVREREAALAGAELSAALAAEERALSRRERLAALASAHAARLASGQTALGASGSTLEAGAVQVRARHLGRLRVEAAALAEAVAAMDAEIAAAAAEAGARADRLAVARGALRALERHREGWRAARAAARDRCAETEADALVIAQRGGR